MEINLAEGSKIVEPNDSTTRETGDLMAEVRYDVYQTTDKEGNVVSGQIVGSCSEC